MNLSDFIIRRQAIKDHLASLTAAETELKQELAQLDADLMNLLDEQGTTSAAVATDGARISVTISEQVVPAVTDWQAVYDYVITTGRFQLFERRMSSAAFRELLANEGEVPGVQPFTRRTVNMQRRVA